MASASPQPEALSPKPARLLSLDAYRGFIMLAMASGGFGLTRVASYFELAQLKTLGGIFAAGWAGPLNVLPWLEREAPGPSPFWTALAHQFEHVAWNGCSFWDLIQPSFMFMVGVAMPYSYASRQAKGDTTPRLVAHVLYRSLFLIGLGVFLSSNWNKQTNFVFTNVLCQIGLGYGFVYLFLGRGLRVQLLAVLTILTGYWLWFALFPLPESGFNYAKVGLKENWPLLPDFFAHWNKNVNAAAHFDQWFLNLFPREKPFVFNDGGYQTLNFVPSMATMLFGVMAGELLRGTAAAGDKLKRLLVAGALCLAVGALLGQTVCPVVKRIWTPSWAIYSTGWTFWMLAAFYWLIDIRGYQRWAFPCLVVGANSIAMYCMAQLLKPWVRDTLKTHLGQNVFQGTYGGHELFAPQFAPIAESTAFLCVLWLICLWMYRQRIFLKI